MDALKYCVNGDGNPVCPPSKVICRACMDKITHTLEDMIKKLKEKENPMDVKRYTEMDGIEVRRSLMERVVPIKRAEEG